MGDKDHDSAAAAAGLADARRARDGKLGKPHNQQQSPFFTSLCEGCADSLLRVVSDSRQSAVADNLHLLSSATLFFFSSPKQPLQEDLSLSCCLPLLELVPAAGLKGAV